MRTRIPEEDLARLEEKVKELMGSGHWQQALEEIRAAAVLYGMGRDELVKSVAAFAIERGHVVPIQLVQTLEETG